MSTLYLGCSAIVFYLSAFIYQIAQLSRSTTPNRALLLGLAAGGVILHGAASCLSIISDTGINFGLWQISSAIFFTVNLIVVVSSFSKPAHNLLLLLFPLTIPVLLAGLFATNTDMLYSSVNFSFGLHVLASILAYSLITLAVFQAIMLAVQNWQLRHKHLGGWIKALPPLQTMEQLLFEILWAGVLLLSASLISGFWLFEDLFTQNLAHKTIFSLAAWVIFAVLLWGRHQLGWRGNTAIRWTVGGFVVTALAYWGSKFVYQVLLNG